MYIYMSIWYVDSLGSWKTTYMYIIQCIWNLSFHNHTGCCPIRTRKYSSLTFIPQRLAAAEIILILFKRLSEHKIVQIGDKLKHISKKLPPSEHKIVQIGDKLKHISKNYPRASKKMFVTHIYPPNTCRRNDINFS